MINENPSSEARSVLLRLRKIAISTDPIRSGNDDKNRHEIRFFVSVYLPYSNYAVR
jgi:hypothetical protein